MVNNLVLNNFFSGELTRKNISYLFDLTIHECFPVWHPLGFITINVIDTAEYIIKLHIWPKGIRSYCSNNWDIHSHNYDFESRIIIGEINHNIYKVFTSLSKTNFHLYEVENIKDGTILKKKAENINFKKVENRKLVNGELYNLSKHVYHSTYVPHNALTASLFKCFKPYSGNSYVLGGNSEKLMEIHTREPVDKEQLLKTLEEILCQYR